MDVVNELLDSEEEFWDSSNEDDELASIFSTDSSSSGPDFEEHNVITDFINVINSYSDGDFKKYFRLNRQTVTLLTDIYTTSDAVNNQQKGGRTAIGAEKEMYVFLWYMGNTNTFRELANLFGIAKSAAWYVVVKVSSWLISIGHNYIKWPSQDEVPSIMASWEQKTKIPYVIGAIDCSHIKIRAPLVRKECYFNRKHYYSVHLQAVVDINKKFIDVFVGEPGSLHDSRVLRRSELYSEAHANKDATFPHGSVILGDSAYPTLEWLIPPFRDNGNLSHEATQFNIIHSSARIVVENAFGILKTRFRRLLHFTEQTNLKLVVNLIVAGCILHNICLSQNDSFDLTESIDDEVVEVSQEGNVENNSRQEINRREQIVNYLFK